jgi:hypothetical protein
MSGYIRAVSRQWLGKHVPSETNTRGTIEILLENEFSVGPCRDVINEKRFRVWLGLNLTVGKLTTFEMTKLPL